MKRDKFIIGIATGMLFVCNHAVFAEQLNSAGQQLQIYQECAVDQDSEMNDASQLDHSLKGYNPKCDLRWALEAGNVLEAAHEKIAKDKNEVVKNAENSEKDSLDADYTCLGAVIQESLDDCKDRVERETLSTLSEVRNRTARYNTTRMELLSQPNLPPEKRKALIAGGISKNAKNPNDTPLSDLYDVSRSYDPKNSNDAAAAAQQRKNQAFVQEFINKALSPQAITFGPPSIDTISGGVLANQPPGSTAPVKVDAVQFPTVGTKTINDPALQKTLGITESHGQLEILSNTSDAPSNPQDAQLNPKLVKALNDKKSKFSKEHFAADQVTYKKAESAIHQMNTNELKRKLQRAVAPKSRSLTSFANSMSEINQNIANNPKTIDLSLSKPAPRGEERLTVTQPILTAPATDGMNQGTWGTPLDKEILEDIK